MNPNSALEDLFSSEFMRWRYFEAFSTSFLLQVFVSTVICTLYKTICYDFIWNPVLLLYHFADGIVKFSWMFRLLLPLLCYVLLTRVHIQSYSVTWWIPEKRLNYISQFFKLKKVFNSFVLVFVCTCLLQCYAFSIHPELSSLTIECSDGKNDEVCISHQALLICFFGLAFGVRLSLKYYLYNCKAVQFPVTQPNFLVRLKSKLQVRNLLKACNFDTSLGFLSFVFCSYVLLGGTISYWIGAFVGASVAEQSYSYMFILSVIIDARFICTILISLGLLAFNLHCFFLIFQDTVLKKIELPICAEESPLMGTDTQVESNWTLSSGMVSSCELLKLLAFRHLRDLAKDESAWGAAYRSKIFTISQPGGHPRNWQRIVNPCLNLIRKFSEKLKQSNKQEEKGLSAAASSSTSNLHKDVNKNQLNQKIRFNFKEKISQIKERMKQLPFVWYLLSDMPDSKNRQIFAESQAVIWAIEGLANIVAKSFTDDQYGVVQKNISDILSTLVQTQLVVEKVGRSMNFRRPAQNAQIFPNDLQLRKSLRLSLKSSLYIITSSYGESIKEVQLSEDVRAKIESYLAFQEG